MGCFPSAKYHFQMGVTVIGFAEHFGHGILFFITVTQEVEFNKAKVRKSMAIPSKFDMAQARGSDKSVP